MSDIVNNSPTLVPNGKCLFEVLKDASCEDSTSNFGNKWMVLYPGECHKISIFTSYFILLLFPTFLKHSSRLKLCCGDEVLAIDEFVPDELLALEP